jgi:hypothetical protein
VRTPAGIRRQYRSGSWTELRIRHLLSCQQGRLSGNNRKEVSHFFFHLFWRRNSIGDLRQENRTEFMPQPMHRYIQRPHSFPVQKPKRYKTTLPAHPSETPAAAQVIQLARFPLQPLQCAIEQRHCPAPFIQLLRSEVMAWNELVSPLGSLHVERYEDLAASPFLSVIAVAFVRDEVAESDSKKARNRPRPLSKSFR